VSIEATTTRASTGDQIDPDQGDAHPRIDHDPLVEDSIENVDEAGATGRPLNRHRSISPREPQRSRHWVERPRPPGLPLRAANSLLEAADLFLEGLVLDRQPIAPGREVTVISPPVQSDLLGLVDRAHDETDTNREELDLGERDLDVTGHDQALVEDAVENVNKSAGSARWLLANQFAFVPWERSSRRRRRPCTAV
jgi:hypothetical protein